MSLLEQYRFPVVQDNADMNFRTSQAMFGFSASNLVDIRASSLSLHSSKFSLKRYLTPSLRPKIEMIWWISGIRTHSTTGETVH